MDELADDGFDVTLCVTGNGSNPTNHSPSVSRSYLIFDTAASLSRYTKLPSHTIARPVLNIKRGKLIEITNTANQYHS